MVYVKGLAVWALIAAAEVLHGIARARLLVPRVGDLRSRQIGVLTGSLLLLALAWACFPWLGLADAAQALRMGAMWLAAMLSFEFWLGRRVFGFSWSRLLADFDPRRGGLLAIGMLLLALAPWLAGRLRGCW